MEADAFVYCEHIPANTIFDPLPRRTVTDRMIMVRQEAEILMVGARVPHLSDHLLPSRCTSPQLPPHPQAKHEERKREMEQMMNIDRMRQEMALDEALSKVSHSGSSS